MSTRFALWSFVALLIPSFASGASDRMDLFKAGDNGYAHYRIPGIVVTGNGTILAYCEARRSLSGDWGTTDLLVRRSTDGGATWEPAKPLTTAPPDVKRNPIALEQKFGQATDVVLDNPVAIAGPSSVHFIYCIEYNRCFYMKSDDDGRTFTTPREITSTFDAYRETYPWRVLATGPGHGVRLANGRLIVPVWLSLGEGTSGHRPSCVATIFSDDAGETWKAGEVVVNHPTLANPSESTVAQLSDGRVMINVRHEGDDPKKPTTRAVFTSDDGATGWSRPPRLDAGLPDPVCMASLLRFDGTRLLFINPANDKDKKRRNLTLRVSEDDGQTWPTSHVIDAGTSGYSDIAASPDRKTVYCFYERDSAKDANSKPKGVAALTFVKLSLDKAKR